MGDIPQGLPGSLLDKAASIWRTEIAEAFEGAKAAVDSIHGQAGTLQSGVREEEQRRLDEERGRLEELLALFEQAAQARPQVPEPLLQFGMLVPLRWRLLPLVPRLMPRDRP